MDSIPLGQRRWGGFGERQWMCTDERTETHHRLCMMAMQIAMPSLMDREIVVPWEDSHKRALRGLRIREG